MTKQNKISIVSSIMLCLFASSCNSNRQNTITPGAYEYYGTVIYVADNGLKINYEGDIPILNGSTIAECKISHLQDNFYSIHSLDVPQGMFENVTVKYITGIQADSTSLIFNFPNLNWDYFGKLKIIVHETLSTTEYIRICDSNNYVIKLPRMKKFYISFAPMEYISYNALYDYHGLLQFDDFHHMYDTLDQDIIITMPNVTMDMFYRWYLDDVIIQAGNESIQLFGNKYKRRSH